MADEAPASATSSTTNPTEKKKKKKKEKKPRKRFDLSGVIIQILSMYAGRGGMSSYCLKKALVERGYDANKKLSRFATVLIQLVNKGVVLRTKGAGVSGSFKLNKNNARNRVKMDKEELVYIV